MPDPERLPDGDPAPPLPESIVAWIVDGALDAPLAATVWLLAEGGVPVVVASRDPTIGASLAEALDTFGRPPALLSVFPHLLEAGSLEEVQARLAEPPHAITEDAIRSVGVVLVLRGLADGRRRVVAAHYVRPLEQDAHGHVQRRPPALLAAWDADADRFDDYAWGITAELAGRAGREPAAFELARADRARLLETMAEAGVSAPEEVAAAVLTAGRAPLPKH
ncbi:MAG: hypothetical protein ABWY52_00585 [Candidatus Limnocylindrales bacterium]